MKRFLFPVLFGVCIAGCLVDTGCAALGKHIDDTLLELIGGSVQETPDTTTPAPSDEATAGEPTAVDDAGDDAAAFESIRLAKLKETVKRLQDALAAVPPEKGMLRGIGETIGIVLLSWFGLPSKGAIPSVTTGFNAVKKMLGG